MISIYEHAIYRHIQRTRYAGCFKKSFTMIFQLLLCGERVNVMKKAYT
jgi:hypothetical protein